MSTLQWGENAKRAAKELNLVEERTINEVLRAVSDRTEESIGALLAANQKDLDKMDPKNPMYDRLKLTEERLRGIAGDIRKVAELPTPQGRIIEHRVLGNGLDIEKVSVPFGVVGIIYEARPNVSFDVFSLCFKSGNVCVLKGGTDAYESNAAIVSLIKGVLREHGLSEDIVTLMPAGREATGELLGARDYVDVIIPRGSAGLIKFVRENSRVPVIETGAGVVHTYVEQTGDIVKARDIVKNAKTRRVSVCNALDCLVIDRGRLGDLAAICAPLAEKNVTIEADPEAYNALDGKYPGALLEHADEESFGTEFIDYRMSIKTVGDYREAIGHIGRYGSGHSESIITEDNAVGEAFLKNIDAACVYVNASTAFTDGGQFGMGAEIGISTQKLHARGPMALPELTTYKWLVRGNGQTRA